MGGKHTKIIKRTCSFKLNTNKDNIKKRLSNLDKIPDQPSSKLVLDKPDNIISSQSNTECKKKHNLNIDYCAICKLDYQDILTCIYCKKLHGPKKDYDYCEACNKCYNKKYIKLLYEYKKHAYSYCEKCDKCTLII